MMKNKEKPCTRAPAFMAEEEKRIAAWMEKLHFRRALFGVDERDVWRKLSELNEMYQRLLQAERIRYDTLLEQKNQMESLQDADGR